MLVTECGQCFSFTGSVISSYFGPSSSFWIANNPSRSITRRNSIRGLRVLFHFRRSVEKYGRLCA